MTGEVYVVPISDDPRRFEPGSRLLDDAGDELVVESVRPHGRRLLVRFEGVESREEAEARRGSLYVTAHDLRALEADEFWEHDLVGCEVVDESGRRFGEVEGVVEGPAQDLLVVAAPAGQRLVPLVGAIVVDVDPAAGRVTIDPPEGLLD